MWRNWSETKTKKKKNTVNLSQTDLGHNGNLFLVKNVYGREIWCQEDQNFKYLYKTEPVCNEQKKKIMCLAIMLRETFHCFIFDALGRDTMLKLDIGDPVIFRHQRVYKHKSRNGK